MTIEDNKAIVIRHLKQVVEEGRVDLIDSYYDQNNSPEGFRQWLTWFRKVSTHLKVTILDMVAEGDKVVAYVQFEATCSSEFVSEYTGEYPPLDQPHSWKAMELYRIVDGKYVSMQGLYDPPGRHFPARKVA